MDGGFSITGNWMNKNNGQVIFVKDSVIDGDNMLIITNRGTIDMNTFSNDYIQVSEDVYDNHGNVIDKSTFDASEMIQYSSNQEQSRHVTPSMLRENNITNNTAAEVSRNVIEETPLENTFDDIELKNSKVEVIREESRTVKEEVKKEVSYNEQLLDKLFTKKKLDKDSIKLNIDINSDTFPKEELNMLKLIYDVTNEDIAKYIKNHIITDDVIIKSIENMIETI